MSTKSTKNLITVNNNWQHSEEYGKKNVSQKLRYLFDTAALSDCEFIVGGEMAETFKAHKLLLAMTSSVFEAMFYGSMAEENSIKITDIEPQIFKKILEYIYTDIINLTSFDEACLVYMGAKKYMLDCLITECVQQMNFFIDSSNAFKAYKFAKFVEDQGLIRKCVDMFCRYTHDILEKTNSEDISLDALKYISEQEYLNMGSEMPLIYALEKYVRWNNFTSDSHNGLTYLDVLKNIRFLTLSPQAFAQNVTNSSLLTENQKLLILKSICLGTVNEIPKGISKSQIRRSPCNEYSKPPRKYQFH